MSQNVSKWLIQSGKIYLQAKIWIILPLHFLENLRKYISAIYCQNYKLHFQPFIEVAYLEIELFNALIQQILAKY